MDVKLQRNEDEYIVFCDDAIVGRIIKGSGDHHYYQPNNMGFSVHPDLLRELGSKAHEVDL